MRFKVHTTGRWADAVPLSLTTVIWIRHIWKSNVFLLTHLTQSQNLQHSLIDMIVTVASLGVGSSASESVAC